MVNNVIKTEVKKIKMEFLLIVYCLLSLYACIFLCYGGDGVDDDDD